MGILDKIKQPFEKKRLRQEQLKGIQIRTLALLSGGPISDESINQLNSYFNESELTVDEYQKIRCDAYAQVVYRAIADRRVTDEEYGYLKHVALVLEIPDNIQSWARQKIQYFRLFTEIEAGGELPTGSPSNLILQKLENCHLSIPASLIEERVVRSKYVGG